VEAKDQRMSRAVRQLASGVGSFSGTVVAIVVALGIPLIWVWIASKIAGTKQELTPSLAVLITTGILVSYWVALVIASWLRGRSIDPAKERDRVRRRSWNRSFSDAPRPGDSESDSIERIFVIVAVLSIIGFEIWFFFFAGDPLPSTPAF
jgi:small-conductance mechanosensitive channel